MKKITILSAFLGVFLAGVSLTSCGVKNKRGAYNIIKLGEYPQDVVGDENLANEIKINGVKSGNKVKYNDKYYVQLKVKPYNYGEDGYNYYYTTKRTVIEDSLMYFEVKPITWRILEETDEYYYVTSEYILFTDTFTDDDIVEDGQNSNNYEKSSIRTYLNGYFYENILNSDPAIMLMNVDNGANSSDGDADNPHLCNDTEDYVANISLGDTKNKKYFKRMDDRYAFATDYLIAQGFKTYQDSTTSFFFGSAEYMTRSPISWVDYEDGTPSYIYYDSQGDEVGGYYRDCIYKISYEGNDDFARTYDTLGVRPCIKVDKSLYTGKKE